MSQAGIISTSGGPVPPSVATSYVTNSGTAIPVANVLNVLGTSVAASAIPVQTTGAANTVTVQVQRTSAQAASSATNAGLASFNSADFTVDANGFVSIANFSPFVYVQINHASSPYTATATDYYISADPTAGTITIDLPNAPTLYREFIIKDRTGKASTNNISVTTSGGTVTIDGQTTYTMASNYSAIQLLFNGSGYEIY
jgi:hypothetical protein